MQGIGLETILSKKKKLATSVFLHFQPFLKVIEERELLRIFQFNLMKVAEEKMKKKMKREG